MDSLYKMASLYKKKSKKTTNAQFELLVTELAKFAEENKDDPLRGGNCLGTSKYKLDKAWEGIARKVNAIGPPQRNISEWKKVYSDLKRRTQMKASENTKSQNATDDDTSTQQDSGDMEFSRVDEVIQMKEEVDVDIMPSRALLSPDLTNSSSCSSHLDQAQVKAKKSDSESGKMHLQSESQSTLLNSLNNMANNISSLLELQTEAAERQAAAMERQAAATEGILYFLKTRNPTGIQIPRKRAKKN